MSATIYHMYSLKHLPIYLPLKFITIFYIMLLYYYPLQNNVIAMWWKWGILALFYLITSFTFKVKRFYEKILLEQ